MTRLALMSDLHFGTVPEGLADGLLRDVETARPDLVVIAGDLTQRARTREWTAAVAWVKQLTAPTLIVPGNHDVPSFDLLERFARPLKRFRTYFPGEADLTCDDVCVVGLNTAARWQPHLNWEEGRVRRRDLDRFDDQLAAAPPCAWRVVAAHHPFAEVPDVPTAEPVRRARDALEIFARHRVALMLSGHTHLAFAHPVAVADGVILSVGAPSALSSRLRGEANGYWLIDVEDDAAMLTLRRATDGAYAGAGSETRYRWRRDARRVERL